jgi:hypothetical protein
VTRPLISNAPVSSPSAIAARLRAAAANLAERGDVATAEAVLTWLDGDASVTLEAALGLPPDGRMRARLENRDTLLIALARRHFPTLTGRRLADAVALAGSRYAGSSWTRDRRSGRRPDGLNGDLFDILSAGEIPGDARLRQIFNGLCG